MQQRAFVREIQLEVVVKNESNKSKWTRSQKVSSHCWRKSVPQRSFHNFERAMVNLVNRFSRRTTKVICDQAFLPTKSQHVVSSLKERKQAPNKPMYMILEEFVACKVFTRKLLGRILRTHVEAHLTYMRVSLNGIQVKTSRVRDNLPWATGM